MAHQDMDIYCYWKDRHFKGNTPWHENELHPYLTNYTSDLDLSPPKRVLLPLCGRCLELLWFYEKGLEVVGVEMVEAPVKQFFEEHNFPFVVKELPWAKLYETKDERLKIYVCNFFDINIAEIGKFEVVWNRGVWTAIEVEDRERYAKLVKSLLTNEFLYLMTTLQFDDKNLTDIVPRPISQEETKRFYIWCNVKLLTIEDISTELYKSILRTDEIWESYYLLTPK